MQQACEQQAGVNPWVLAAVMILPTFMVVLDTSVANVALPHIAGSLSTSSYEATWMLTSYLVANAIILPATAWLSRFFGRKKFLLVSIVLFTLASVVSGAAMSLGMLVVARVVQGASGGALVPISQAVLLESFPPEERAQAMGIFGLGIVVAPVIGPTLGGWITDAYSWRWVFYINLPVGVLAVLLIQMLVEDPPYMKARAGGRIDYIGFVLMAAGLGALQVVLDRGQHDNWFAAEWIRWFTFISAGSLISFVIWELRVEEPLVDLRILRDRNFGVGVAMATIYGVVLYSTLVLLPLFLQNLLGYTALAAGLAISPRGFGAMFAVTVAGRLTKKIDGRILIVCGFLLMAYAGFLLGDVDMQATMGSVMWPNILIGAALGFVFVPLTTLAVETLPNEQMGTATGLYNLLRNMGGSMGIALVSTMMARDAQRHQAMMVGHVTPSDPASRHLLHYLRGLFASRTDVVDATHQAYLAIYHIVVQQSILWAYIDNFRMLSYVALIGVPFALLLKRSSPNSSSH